MSMGHFHSSSSAASCSVTVDPWRDVCDGFDSGAAPTDLTLLAVAVLIIAAAHFGALLGGPRC